MKRAARVLAVVTLIVGATFGARYLIREAQAESAYTTAQRNQSEEIILAKLGKPDETLLCGESLWWNGDQVNPPQNNGECKKWVRYNFFLHAFAFGYSSSGLLVSRYEYSSE